MRYLSALMLIPLLLPRPALAQDRLNRQIVASVSVVHAFKQAQPWGVRASVSHPFALRDHCAYAETDCYRGALWPVAGPVAALGWRGGPRVELDLAIEGGVAELDMYHFGFLPRAAALARTGVRVDLGERGAGWLLGGTLARSAGFDRRLGEHGYRTYGSHGIGLRVDLDAAPFLGDGWRPTLAAGAWAVLGATGSYD